MLRQACSFSCRAGLRSFAAQAADASQPEGVKSILVRLLRGADQPQSSAELWAKAEGEGIKSKRHMKQLLAEMKSNKQVVTKPLGQGRHGKRAKSYGYILPLPTSGP